MPTLALPTRRFFGGRQFAEAERCLAQLASDETQDEEGPSVGTFHVEYIPNGELSVGKTMS